MSSFLRAASFAGWRDRAPPRRLLLLSLLLGGCAAQPAPPFAGPDPASVAAPSAPLRYRSTVGAFTHLHPVETPHWPGAGAAGAAR